jgi:hypothetical protein
MAFVAFCRRRRGVWVLVTLAAIAVLARLAPAPEAEVAPAPEPTWRLVPLAGAPLEAAVDDADGEYVYDTGWAPGTGGSCVPFLPALVARPRWQLQIVERASGCLGTDDRAALLVDERGRVTIVRANVPVPMLTAQLTPDELARLRTLDELSCVRTESYGYGELFYELGWGPTASGDGAHIGASSELGQAVGAVVERALARAAEERLTRTPFRLRLDALAVDDGRTWRADRAVFEITIDHTGTLRVSRAGRVRYQDQLDPIAVVELMDTILPANVREPDVDLLARGSVLIDDERHPIALARYDLFSMRIQDWLWRATDR